ncbi:hypothetical protein SAMD00019534_049200 [Acytostelium subglobosum LB1]|uniref:hypothetical protein n=1 Tax=Acytostelium subglobosum LB1 TaxID=1410327 RepID=UPI000644CD57|nr:hypothetical protein SAMD00019534_049200 [Acytostelium subglobosum LB1]GAM21745.1 hypothetical protein SAMD00019534_049200 [Acytostelium subglobosum LB1]|eukprot:XP_012754845.1 hypothetical protein SAMD00019534_049200 [Acytostelium subglobosum LB1]
MAGADNVATYYLYSMIASSLSNLLTREKFIREAITTTNIASRNAIIAADFSVWIPHALLLFKSGKYNAGIELINRNIKATRARANKKELDATHNTFKQLLASVDQIQSLRTSSKEHIKSKMKLLTMDKTLEQLPIKVVWEDDADGPNNARKLLASKDIPKGTVLMRVAPLALTLSAIFDKSACATCFMYTHVSSMLFRIVVVVVAV